ncbi:hypothetical protein [Paraburkholderia sp. GAS32]|uniref:hypothetical protein n=1 Tax=Paraburkholderia sp. GAS32 TaxID=3035129 RepID=UPI003D25B58F
MFAHKSTAKVTCVREVSGFAVWYHRALYDEKGRPMGSNGDYLLRFFAWSATDEAIEFAVNTATDAGQDMIEVRALDALIEKAMMAIKPFHCDGC